jgi:diaminopimelate decarboxylase
MSVFHYQNNILHIESMSTRVLALDYGTPLYVYSRQAIEQAWHGYADTLGDRGLVCYAVKANSNLAVLNILARLGSGFDIVSIGELERVLAAGGQADRVVFSGVAKQADDLKRALQVGIRCFNVESLAELRVLNTVAGSMDLQAPVSIRVNPDVDAKTHPYISTGLKHNKFGIDITEAEKVYHEADRLPHIRVVGVDCHIGSQITTLEPFMDALDRLLQLVDRLADQGIVLEHLDVGGGIGVQYQESDTVPALSDYVSQILAKIGKRPQQLILEPGRSIVAKAGAFLTKVVYLKETADHHFAIVDGGMNDLIRPALYQAWQEIKPVKQRFGESVRWDIVGPICETADFLGHDRLLTLQQGDVVAVMDSGAYGFVMSSNYNARNRAAELVIDGDQVHVARRRETIKDQMALETILKS